MEDTFDSCQFNYTYLPMGLSQFIREKVYMYTQTQISSYSFNATHSLSIGFNIYNFKFGVTIEHQCESTPKGSEWDTTRNNSTVCKCVEIYKGGWNSAVNNICNFDLTLQELWHKLKAWLWT